MFRSNSLCNGIATLTIQKKSSNLQITCENRMIFHLTSEWMINLSITFIYGTTGDFFPALAARMLNNARISSTSFAQPVLIFGTVNVTQNHLNIIIIQRPIILKSIYAGFRKLDTKVIRNLFKYSEKHENNQVLKIFSSNHIILTNSGWVKKNGKFSKKSSWLLVLIISLRRSMVVKSFCLIASVVCLLTTTVLKNLRSPSICASVGLSNAECSRLSQTSFISWSIETRDDLRTCLLDFAERRFTVLFAHSFLFCW